MTQIISFLLSVVFAIDMFFIGLFLEKQLIITQTETESEYYVNGETDNLRFGVVGNGNLFEPDEEIKVVIECLDESLNGTKAKISVRSEQTDFDKRGAENLSAPAAITRITKTNGESKVSATLPMKQRDATAEVHAHFRSVYNFMAISQVRIS